MGPRISGFGGPNSPRFGLFGRLVGWNHHHERPARDHFDIDPGLDHYHLTRNGLGEAPYL